MKIEVMDRVIDWIPGQRASGFQNITMSNIIFDTHFPLKPIWPGMLSIMALQRLAEGVLSSQNNFSTTYRLTNIGNIKWRFYVKPGDCMQVEVEVLNNSFNDKLQMKGNIKVADKTVVTVGMMTFQAVPSTIDTKQSLSSYWKLRGAQEVVVI
ncbi:hypothetical protein [Paenibacillus endoradicis]|uniref:hypothetical protein n=1 Tax=Paenibacillus endoradicis TaxID=2972487 RepID=UPI002158A4AE|nr:hypothetical protein [Paenibacillus endoradicis]MCR8657739.1 hypothetical protein [Paenibacillus endoradicis]